MELVHYFGVLVRNADLTWKVLADVGHEPQGLLGVTVDSMERLVVTYPPVLKIGMCWLTADDTWCGRYQPGASAGLALTRVTIRQPGGLQVYPSALVGQGNIRFELWGWVA